MPRYLSDCQIFQLKLILDMQAVNLEELNNYDHLI